MPDAYINHFIGLFIQIMPKVLSSDHLSCTLPIWWILSLLQSG